MEDTQNKIDISTYFQKDSLISLEELTKALESIIAVMMENKQIVIPT